MKIGLKVQPLRGIVAIRGHAGSGRALDPIAKVVLDVQVVSQDEVNKASTEDLPAGRIAIHAKCAAFATELEALFLKYGLELWDRETH